jgi:hypothetical protein
MHVVRLEGRGSTLQDGQAALEPQSEWRSCCDTSRFVSHAALSVPQKSPNKPTQYWKTHYERRRTGVMLLKALP